MAADSPVRQLWAVALLELSPAVTRAWIISTNLRGVIAKYPLVVEPRETSPDLASPRVPRFLAILKPDVLLGILVDYE